MKIPASARPGRVRGVLVAALLAIAIGIAAYLSAGRWLNPPPAKPSPVDPGQVRQREALPVPKVRFTDVTDEAGIRFKHVNGSFGQKLLPETMGSGVAFLDFDDDGKEDILFVNSRDWPGHQPADKPAPTLALYRNHGDGTFQDVTAAAGLGVAMFGMGVTAGDFDNDGWIDLFVTGVGGNRLFRNELGANGRVFRDVTAKAGVGGPGGWPAAGADDFLKHSRPLAFSSSAAFFDYDGDGRLDLFVCNYVTWAPVEDHRQGFKLVGLGRAFGPPRAFEGSQNILYRNNGDGTFEDVSKEAGIQVHEKEGTDAESRMRSVGKSLGAIVADVDEDGWPDLVVANDTVRNFFFHNVPGPNGKRVFEEVGLPSGVAYAEGTARGAMGVDWADDYRPGRRALLIGNFANEPNTFLCLDDARRLQFSDVALAEGIAGPSRGLLKFGVFFFDYDLDGRLDILTCNGHLEPEISSVQASQTYEQPAQLFWNTGVQPRGFEPVTADAAGPDLFKPLVGRGCAFADINGDGTLDVVLTANGGTPRLLRNDGGTGHHWLRLKLEGDGKRSNRGAIGARVEVEAGGTVQRREVVSARGYLSQSELTLTFGLRTTDKVDKVTVRWPGRDAGPPTVLKNLAVDKVHVIRQEAAK